MNQEDRDKKTRMWQFKDASRIDWLVTAIMIDNTTTCSCEGMNSTEHHIWEWEATSDDDRQVITGRCVGQYDVPITFHDILYSWMCNAASICLNAENNNKEVKSV